MLSERNTEHLFLLFRTHCPMMFFSPKGEFIILRTHKAVWWITSCIPSNLIIHLVGKYQLHQHKGVCYIQVATHPMTAWLGGANILRKQELRLCWAVIAPNICFTHIKRIINTAPYYNNLPRYWYRKFFFIILI